LLHPHHAELIAARLHSDAYHRGTLEQHLPQLPPDDPVGYGAWVARFGSPTAAKLSAIQKNRDALIRGAAAHPLTRIPQLHLPPAPPKKKKTRKSLTPEVSKAAPAGHARCESPGATGK
jgi:hypothetical protein